MLIALKVPSTCTLADFLINNEGRRCVVVLDVSAIDMCIRISFHIQFEGN